MDASTINALISGLGPFGAVIALLAYAILSKPKVSELARPVSPQYERDMVAAMERAAMGVEGMASALKATSLAAERIERHLDVLLERRKD